MASIVGRRPNDAEPRGVVGVNGSPAGGEAASRKASLACRDDPFASNGHWIAVPIRLQRLVRAFGDVVGIDSTMCKPTKFIRERKKPSFLRRGRSRVPNELLVSSRARAALRPFSSGRGLDRQGSDGRGELRGLPLIFIELFWRTGRKCALVGGNDLSIRLCDGPRSFGAGCERQVQAKSPVGWNKSILPEHSCGKLRRLRAQQLHSLVALCPLHGLLLP